MTAFAVIAMTAGAFCRKRSVSCIRLHTVHHRHHMIQQNDIIIVLREFVQTFLPACRRIKLYFQSSKQPSGHCDIDTVIITAEMMQAIYDSAEQHHEIDLT